MVNFLIKEEKVICAFDFCVLFMCKNDYYLVVYSIYSSFSLFSMCALEKK